MGVLIFFAVIAYIVYAIANAGSNEKSGKKSTTRQSTSSVPTPRRSAPLVTIKMNVKKYTPDDSVIEVTGKPYRLTPADQESELTRYRPGVPHWQHQYVYSYSEIKAASNEQITFYKVFKASFLRGEYLDLEGNLNYAFILFFDLLDEFLQHGDLDKIKSQLKIIGRCYSKTRNYAKPELIKRLVQMNNHAAILELGGGYQYSDYYDIKLGDKYKKQLKLNAEDVKVLNTIWVPSNNFAIIDYCCVQIIHLFLSTVKGLEIIYQGEGSSLDEQLTAIADIVARKHYNFRSGSSNYKESLEGTKRQVYGMVFKDCENTVRDVYNHKRKLANETFNEYSQKEYDSRIGSKLEALHMRLRLKVSPPDDTTELVLNTLNTSRWKLQFEKLTENFDGNAKTFLEGIRQLTLKNKKNPSLEHIYYESAKFIAKSDKQISLTLYMYYLYCDLQSVKFDHKPLTKTVLKVLFNSEAQLEEFDKLQKELIATKNLDKALATVSQFYAPKRKKIELDKEAIAQAKERHSQTVEMLNEYLQDDNEEGNVSISSNVAGPIEHAGMAVKEAPSEVNSVVTEGLLAGVQQELVELFQSNHFRLSSEAVNEFAKSRGLFKNSLIEGINDKCYETLDDVLIEEEGEEYVLNSNYYNTLFND